LKWKWYYFFQTFHTSLPIRIRRPLSRGTIESHIAATLASYVFIENWDTGFREYALRDVDVTRTDRIARVAIEREHLRTTRQVCDEVTLRGAGIHHLFDEFGDGQFHVAQGIGGHLGVRCLIGGEHRVRHAADVCFSVEEDDDHARAHAEGYQGSILGHLHLAHFDDDGIHGADERLASGNFLTSDGEDDLRGIRIEEEIDISSDSSFLFSEAQSGDQCVICPLSDVREDAI